MPDVPQGNVNGLNISPGSVSEGDEVILDGLTVATGDDNETVYFDIFVKQDGSNSIIDAVDGSLYAMGVVNHDDEYMVPWGPALLMKEVINGFMHCLNLTTGRIQLIP